MGARVPAGDQAHYQAYPLPLIPSLSLTLCWHWQSGSAQGNLKGTVLHRALKVVVHAAHLGEEQEALNAGRRGWAAQPLARHAS